MRAHNNTLIAELGNVAGNLDKTGRFNREILDNIEGSNYAVDKYVEEKSEFCLKDQMILGYQEMADINLSITSENQCLEEEVQILIDKVFGE